MRHPDDRSKSARVSHPNTTPSRRGCPPPKSCLFTASPRLFWTSSNLYCTTPLQIHRLEFNFSCTARSAVLPNRPSATLFMRVHITPRAFKRPSSSTIRPPHAMSPSVGTTRDVAVAKPPPIERTTLSLPPSSFPSPDGFVETDAERESENGVEHLRDKRVFSSKL